MVEHHKRRRRKPEAVATQPKKRQRRVATRHEIPKPTLRPVYRIALSLFEAYDKFGGHKHKVYQQFRVLFCITTANDKYNQWDDNTHILKKVWSGKEAIEEWLEGTKSVRNKQVQLYREELSMHLEA